MIVVSKPLGGLLSIPDFGLSNVLSKNINKRKKKWRKRVTGFKIEIKTKYKLHTNFVK